MIKINLHVAAGLNKRFKLTLNFREKRAVLEIEIDLCLKVLMLYVLLLKDFYVLSPKEY